MARAMLRAMLAAAVLAVPIVGGASAATAQGSEQVVFSGIGTGTFGDFGFWVWCQVEDFNPYETDCNGSMYFYDLGLVRHVEGDVTETAEDTYQMDLTSTLDNSVDCTLTNVPPIKSGPRNTVNATCSAPSGSGSSTNAVVVASG